jgi:D-beta-D-heptose 7-phosphate kinase / D-beta-D-heptose 1-phosphate adenosyltransferase
METLFERCFHGPRPTVLVVGDIMCDTYVWGKVARISPEAPVPIFESTAQRQVLGGAANVAANLCALGCHVRLLGVIGSDAAGHCIRELLHQQHIPDTWLLEDATRPTTEKTRLVAQQQQMLRLDRESRAPLSAALVTRALRHVQALLPEVDGVVCSDYAKGVCSPALLTPLFALAQALKRPLMVDPKADDFALYRGATVLKPNLLEAERASGRALSTPEALQQAAELLLQHSQARALLVTRGKDGMALFQPSRMPLYVPAQAREVFDVTGAGDTAMATFSMAVLCGLSFEEAARLANMAAGIVVGKLGTAVVSPEELRTALRVDGVPSAHKVMPPHELSVRLQYHRQGGERLVFTNGCFDLLHIGHIQYLQQARALGDRLIVALNDDASVRQLKGPGRPVISQEQRAQIMAALACVDYVTLFSEATPLELITQLRPDILVKGGDYTPETVVGRDVVEAYGGQVCLMPYVSGVSTSAILRHIMAG